jgi:hypothetical protein
MSNPVQTTAEKRRSKLWDRVLLVGIALFLCMAGVGSAILGEIYHINSAWIFFAWNSIFLIPIVGRDFRSHRKRPAFIAFFGAWMVLHGAFMVLLTARVPILYWAPFIVSELFVGYFVAYLLFGVLPESQGRE